MMHSTASDFSWMRASRSTAQQDTIGVKKGFLFLLSSLLQPPVLSMKLRAKGERLFSVSLLGGHLSRDGAHARAEEETTSKEASRQQL